MVAAIEIVEISTSRPQRERLRGRHHAGLFFASDDTINPAATSEER
jgi:hypothetical protein